MELIRKPFGPDIGPLVIKRCRQVENKGAEEVEEVALGPRPNPSGAETRFFPKPLGPDIGP